MCLPTEKVAVDLITVEYFPDRLQSEKMHGEIRPVLFRQTHTYQGVFLHHIIYNVVSGNIKTVKQSTHSHFFGVWYRLTFQSQGYEPVIGILDTLLYEFLIITLREIMVTQMTLEIDAVVVQLP